MTNLSDKNNLDNKAIAASEERLRALVNATVDVVYSMSPDWRVMSPLDGRGFIKDTAEPITDWQQANLYPDDLPIVNAAIQDAIREKKTFQLEHRVKRVDGSIGWTFSRAVPILDDNGEIIEWFGVASDITERKEAEEALRITKERSEQQRRLYETITGGTPDLMYVFSLDYLFTYANSALLTMWGKTWDNAVGKGLRENGYEEWHALMHEREIDEVRATKQPVRGEVSFPHAVLGKRVYDYILTPVFDAQGEVEAVAGTTRDVTDRKRWEDALAQTTDELQVLNEEIASTNEELTATNEELTSTNDELQMVNDKLEAAQRKLEEGELALRLAIEAANFGTWFINSETREFVVDTRLKELFGYYANESFSVEQALAQITDEYREFVAGKLENAIYNNGDYDVTYPVIGLHDNKLRWLRAIGNLKADPSGGFSAFTGVVMDITEPYLAAQKVERAEESLRIAIDAAGLGTFSLNAADRTFEASAKLKEFFGFDPDEVMPYEAAIEQIHPNYREKVLKMVEHSITTGERYDIEYPVLNQKDGSTLWVRGIGTMQHYDGKDFFTGVLHDITERRQDDMRKNDFIGMVSHELKTPLTSLNAIVQVANAKLKTSDDQFLAGAMAKANTQVKRMSTMINGFLNISRLESGKIMIEKSHFNIEELVREVADELKVTTSTHTITLDTCQPITVFADKDKINSVISNLVSNAVKYSPKDTSIHVGCEVKQKQLIISVKDEGIGIQPSDSEKIFDRYYRVESSNTQHISGFGIGLYLSAEIVQRHGGKIWLDSEPGKGSTFYFSLPL